jgi:perosamine synthetase
MPNKVKLSPVDIEKKDIDAVSSALKSGWLAHGNFNKKFEDQFIKLHKVKKAITLNSCTAALDLALRSHNFPKNSEVILPSFTWTSTANVVCLNNLKPVFVDINYDDFQINPNLVEKSISKKTVAVIGVHFSGLMCDVIRLKKICDKYKLIFIEDSAECIGVSRDGFFPGQKGIGCFSFYPTKNITTCEGGILTFNDNKRKIHEKAKALSAHGILKHTIERSSGKKEFWHREATYPGFNYRMPNPLAALGLSQIRRIKDMLSRRKKIAKVYDDFLNNYSFIHLPSYCSSKGRSSYQMYTFHLQKGKKNKIIKSLNENGIEASSHFDPPLHKQKAYLNHYKSPFPLIITEKVSKNIVSLPMSSSMNIKDAYRVTKELKKIFG